MARALVDGAWVDGDLEVDDGKVLRVGVRPAGSGMAAPGFVDLQVNGFGGVDLMDADVEGYATVGAAVAATGVTAYQPTFVTAPVGRIRAALDTMRRAQGRHRAPRILGAHLEGPFLAAGRAGTHTVAHLRAPELRLLEDLLAAGPVTQVTLAPELPGSLALVRTLTDRGVLVSAGHSDAGTAAARDAFDAGVRTVTHLFNAMRPFAHRDPSLPGVALSRADVAVQLIVDGVHLAPETAVVACRAAAGRFVLVTDAIAAAGVGEGTWRLGDVEVTVRGLEARRADGVLAGSVLTMDAAVRNVVGLGIPIEEALAAAAERPARLVAPGRAGVLGPGRPADIVVLGDDLRVRQTLVDGRPLL